VESLRKAQESRRGDTRGTEGGSTQEQGEPLSKENPGLRSKDTTYDYMEDNTRNTQYPGQDVRETRR
jgi:hypothetical protein